MQRLVCQQTQLELDALWNGMPMKAVPQHVLDMILLLGFSYYNNIVIIMIVEFVAAAARLVDVCWRQRDGIDITDDARINASSDGAGGSKLTIRDSKPADSALYSCIAKNDHGFSKTAASLRVLGKQQCSLLPARTSHLVLSVRVFGNSWFAHFLVYILFSFSCVFCLLLLLLLLLTLILN